MAYRANIRASIRTISMNIGFEVSDLILTEGRSEYMSVNLYMVGIIYERIVKSSDLFQDLRILMIGVLQKPQAFD